MRAGHRRPKAVLVPVALALALAVSSCTLPGRTTGPLELTATFDDVGDLVANHSVQVADVRVGSIDKIELTRDFKAKVTMSVKDVDVPRDSKAVLRQTSLLGEKFIELRPLREGAPHGCPCLEDGDNIAVTEEAPELEYVAESAIGVLGGVAANDVATLVNTGAAAFGGRGPELRRLIDDLATLSSTLSSRTGNIVTIIEELAAATSTLGSHAGDIDQLLANLAGATTTLSENREQLVQTLRDLTRLARTQNEVVFDPYLEQASRQIKELDAIVATVAAGRQEVATLLDWLARFTVKIPEGVPDDFAQIYGWLVLCPLVGDPGCGA